MKRIINGMTYNTETAEHICTGDNGCEMSDGYRRTEELYRTPKGRYFVYSCNMDIIPIVNDQLILPHNQYQETSTVHEWLSTWNVDELPDREIKHFNITEA